MTAQDSSVFRRLPLRYNEVGLCVAILVVVVVTTALDSNHTYWNDPVQSLKMVARQTALLGIFSLGAGVVIIAGGIDLSSGSMICFGGTLCASFMVLLAPEAYAAYEPLGLDVIGLAIAGTLVVGFLVGTMHAWLITVVGLPPFIATLGSLVGLRSLARALCGNVTDAMWDARSTQIQVYDDRFRYLATSVWIPVVIFVVLSVSIWILLSHTVVGRHLYAMGGNEEAARLSGIRTDRIKWMAYVIGTMTATIAGILYIGEESVAFPQALGRGYELNAIAAAVVGGCSLQGGLGTVTGTVLGVVFLRTVIDAVNKIIKTGADTYEGLIVGLVLVVAVAFSQLRQAVRQGKEVFPGLLGISAIVALAASAGVLTALMVGKESAKTSGYGAAGIVFVLLAAVKTWEWKRQQSRRQT